MRGKLSEIAKTLTTTNNKHLRLSDRITALEADIIHQMKYGATSVRYTKEEINHFKQLVWPVRYKMDTTTSTHVMAETTPVTVDTTGKVVATPTSNNFDVAINFINLFAALAPMITTIIGAFRQQHLDQVNSTTPVLTPKQ